MDVTTLNPWISWRTYRVPGSIRTLVLNQRSREFLLLEDDACEVWEKLVSASLQFEELADVVGLPRKEVDEFCRELMEAGLIRSSPSRTLSIGSNSSAPFSQDLEREMMQWVEQHGFIYAAHWEVTYRCNELCVHCYNPGAAHAPQEKPARERDELSTHEAKQLLRELADIGVFRLTLSGGEVTLRRDFLELLSYARGLGFQVVIYTNGLKLSDELLEKTKELYPFSVEVSIHSSDPAEHDGVTRVPGSFQRTLRTLAYFKSAGVHTVFKSSLTKTTINGWEATSEFGVAKADAVILNSIVSPGVDGKLAPLATAAEFGQLVVLAASPGSPLYVGSEEQNWGRTPLPDQCKKPCGAGHSSIAITPEGQIYPCIAFPMPIGDYRTSGLKDLKRRPPDLTSSPPDLAAQSPTAAFDRWRAVRMKDLKECGKHDRCHFCNDLCPGDAYVQTGNALKAATNHCRQAFARMTASQHLRSGISLTQLRSKFGITETSNRPTRRIIPIRPHHIDVRR